MQQGAERDDTRRLLFICTGNYYRSRFAEHLFNELAVSRGLRWQADSRGTDISGAGRWNVGPISDLARKALADRGVMLTDPRHPAQLRHADFEAADRIVAVCEAEHRPHLERDFGEVAGRVEYWGVQDLAFTPADDALGAIDRHVRDLVERLAADPGHP